VREIYWSEDKDFCVSLSHDIDYWNYWNTRQKFQTLFYNLRTIPRRPLNALWKIFGHGLHKNLLHNPWRNVKRIIRQETDLGVKSTWFLLARDDFEDQRQNYFSDPVSKEQIIDLLGQQEVGLHGSPESAFDPVVLQAELDKLRELGFDPKGFRTHYLHFDYQKSFTILEMPASISTPPWVTGKILVSALEFPFHSSRSTLRKTALSEFWRYL
jgi:hypothetical protein